MTIILSLYGGITFFAFSYFPTLQYCTTMYVFMTNLTFLGSLCLNWLLYPPEILLYKPWYFPRLYNSVIAQFFVMAISFFLELTTEDPYVRKSIYIEGVTFIFLCMLYFLIKFFLIYYFSYGWLYKSYLVHTVALSLKRRKKRIEDEQEIADAVGREVDAGLRDEIDERMGDIDLDYYRDDEDADKPFQLSSISAEVVFERVEKYFDKTFGGLSLKLFQNYYTDHISSMLNRTVIMAVLILNFIASKYSVYIYFFTGLLLFNIDDTLKTSLYRF